MSQQEIGQAGRSAFRRATFCAANECVEVGQRDQAIIVRDSSQKSGEVVLYFAAADWVSFARSVKRGKLDSL
jgi:Domain of unknown function (DUF397)